MENTLKQQTLDLQADRMSTHFLASNQLRFRLATFAYLLMERLRGLGLAGTDLACATAGSVRLKLLKVAAQGAPAMEGYGHLGDTQSPEIALKVTFGGNQPARV
jgi:hypothetical protein